MIKDVYCNVVIPIVVAVEVANRDDDGCKQVKAMFHNGDLDERIFSSFNEGNAMLKYSGEDDEEF